MTGDVRLLDDPYSAPPVRRGNAVVCEARGEVSAVSGLGPPLTPSCEPPLSWNLPAGPTSFARLTFFRHLGPPYQTPAARTLTFWDTVGAWGLIAEAAGWSIACSTRSS